MMHKALMGMGMAIKHHIAHGSSREKAIEEVAQEYFNIVAGSPDLAADSNTVTFARALTQGGPPFALAWAESAFSTIELSHRLAASLMCTSVSAEAVSDVPLPWDCFCIAIPPGLLPATTWAPSHIIVRRVPDGVHTLEIGAGTLTISGEKAISHYARHEPAFEIMSMPDSRKEEHSAYARLALLMGRLLVGVCIEMDTPSGRQIIARTPSTPRMKRGEPRAWSYRLGRPVSLDVREGVRSYLSGDRSGPMSVQVLVCGHRKRQPHGPGGTLRKWIHIEPYWRGPEEAPILVRPHELKKE